ASEIRLDAPEKERTQQIREQADAVIEEWKRYQRSMPQRLKDALKDSTRDGALDLLKKAGEKLSEAVAVGGPSVVAGAVAHSMGGVPLIVAGSGFAFGVVFQVARRLFSSKKEDPFAYLTHVRDKGATLATIPKSARSTD